MTRRLPWLLFALIVALLIAVPKWVSATADDSVLFYCKEGYCAAEQSRVEWMIQYVRRLENLVIDLREKLKGQCT
jgi:hypothetical protein